MYKLYPCSTSYCCGHTRRTCQLYTVRCSCCDWNYDLLSAGWLWLTQLRNSTQPPTDEHNGFLQAVIDRCRKEHAQFLNGGGTQCSDNPALFCLLGWSDGLRPSEWVSHILMMQHSCMWAFERLCKLFLFIVCIPCWQEQMCNVSFEYFIQFSVWEMTWRPCCF